MTSQLVDTLAVLSIYLMASPSLGLPGKFSLHHLLKVHSNEQLKETWFVSKLLKLTPFLTTKSSALVAIPCSRYKKDGRWRKACQTNHLVE